MRAGARTKRVKGLATSLVLARSRRSWEPSKIRFGDAPMFIGDCNANARQSWRYPSGAAIYVMTISLNSLLAQRERLLNHLYRAQTEGEYEIAQDLRVALDELNNVLAMVGKNRTSY